MERTQPVYSPNGKNRYWVNVAEGQPAYITVEATTSMDTPKPKFHISYNDDAKDIKELIELLEHSIAWMQPKRKRKNTKKWKRVLTQNTEGLLQSPMEEKVWLEYQRNGLNPMMQLPIGPYWADFGFPDQRVVVEYDGLLHRGRRGRDDQRDGYIQSHGWEVYHIWREDGYYHTRIGDKQVARSKSLANCLPLLGVEVTSG